MAKKAKGLPFVVKPRLAPIMEQIGNEDIGVFEIERRGYLTVAEKAFAQASNIDDDALINLQSLTAKISRETGKTRSEVMTAIVEDFSTDFLSAYADEIGYVAAAMSLYDEKVKFVRATALLFSRVDPEWSIEQTLELAVELVAELAQLFEDEEARDTTAIQASMDASTGVEKKGKS